MVDPLTGTPALASPLTSRNVSMPPAATGAGSSSAIRKFGKMRESHRILLLFRIFPKGVEGRGGGVEAIFRSKNV